MKLLSVIAALLLSSFLNAQPGVPKSSGAVPRLVNFSGKALDEQGKPMAGITGVSFAIYKDQFEDDPLWMETQNAMVDAEGNYTVQLGATSVYGLPLELFSSAGSRWLGVRVNAGREQPRVLLLSVPYALKAADAQTLGGYPASAFLLAGTRAAASAPGSSVAMPQPVPAAATAVTTAGGAPNALAKFDGRSDIIGSQIFDNGTGVGIGISKPTVKLDVNGATTIHGPLLLPFASPATATAGRVSQPQGFSASSFNSSTASAVAQTFQWQAEPTGNNTDAPSANLSLLFKSVEPAPVETGLSISSQGIIQFAPGQTFPQGSGSGTVTSVGLSAPAADFTVSGGPVTGSGVLGLNWVVAPTYQNIPYAIVKRDAYGNATLNNLLAAGGITGIADMDAVSAISGFNKNSGSNAVGVEGDVNGAGTGVVGFSFNGGRGVKGEADGSSGQGVKGESFGYTTTADGFGPDGVDGIAHSDAGSGVAALNTAGGDAIFAQSAYGFAGYFLGNVAVQGNLSKAGGSFKIDHPLDPANKYLSHSFVESPDMKNIYDGVVTTNAQGKAVVQMPEWFEALNRDFRYQLTVMGQFAQAIVAGEMTSHSFIILTDKPNVKVSWQVTGTRHDAWADAHRIPVEQAKPDKERGLYLHPELFGAPVEKSIGAAHHPIAIRVLKQDKILVASPKAK
ncbi:autotransporter outer membrane beta-barrel domain-containing protein [Occallatibacter riparius]|uniref:Carboxypeptidase regulatory-like domain-containing protein n=1 Tax=Occallatibacter riparius TaxID=1002689 RepID=A0A9J7BSA5_9BACT|nr:hypothetical protein [Occallatibacter riparius]UWZ85755.1 hypothetical protein MOP44_07370 [Occallatibacter riparius]